MSWKLTAAVKKTLLARPVHRGMAVAAVSLIALLTAVPAHAASYFVTVAGLGGEPEYEQRFTAMANDLETILKKSGGNIHVYTLTGSNATRENITSTMQKVAGDAKPEDDFILTLIGHGSYDNVEYKFNLPGPDISASDLAALCDKIPAKRQLIVNTTSSSGGSVTALQKPGRIVIAATKTGTEKNATVFARYWIDALRDPSADQNKDEGISAVEAFEYADRKTASFYDTQKHLATEHAVIEDTGKKEAVRAPATDNGEGLLASNFVIVRFGETQKEASDPAKQALLAKREDLERQIDTLKYQKAAMDSADYTKQLTQALVELAKVQEELDK